LSNAVKSVAIVGGGASGLLCAILCARKFLKVDIYEQNSKCAKKILVSGNGRCNITNTNLSINDFFSDNHGFVKDALDAFGFVEFQKFANSIGLILDIKEDGRAYPLSNEAKSVVELLLSCANNLGVKIHLDSKVSDIKKLTLEYDKVVISTGSSAASHLGGNDDGCEFAKEFSHNIIPSYPSLVQLQLNSKTAAKMSGAKISGEVTLLINNKKDISSLGDILFTSYGVSGFSVLDISQRASVALMEYSRVDLSINLIPSFDAQKLSSHISKLALSQKNFSILNILSGLIPIKIVKGLLDELNISQELSGEEITTKLSKKIANTMLNWRFEVEDTHGFRHAEVAGGGVDTTQINPKTMESLKQKNLYFTGEVLDVVGRRGGYNFAFAWSSAYLAAQDIIKDNS
jgi:hypothetical protein